jgi:HemY protein
LLWSQIPREFKQTNLLITAYVKQLIALKTFNKAELVLKQALNQHWDPALIMLAQDIITDDISKQLTTAEQWLKEHHNDPELLFYCGKLCFDMQLWGKSRSYLAMSLSLKRQSKTLLARALLAEKLGETESAAQYFREAALAH